MDLSLVKPWPLRKEETMQLCPGWREERRGCWKPAVWGPPSGLAGYYLLAAHYRIAWALGVGERWGVSAVKNDDTLQ